MTDTVPLPAPNRVLYPGYRGVVESYDADQMHDYAAAVSSADNAELRADLTVACHQFGLEETDNDVLRERVKVLEDALREYIAAADYSELGSDDVTAMLRFGEADRAARAALEGRNESAPTRGAV